LKPTKAKSPLEEERIMTFNHAKIIKHPDHYTVEDLKSTNGTLLNDKQIQKANLSPNDIVTIGKHTLQIKSTDEIKPAVQDLADRTVKVSGSQ
jgi:pSer/pThr/pTyr-binding forkhead associated (FHA) protein